MNNSRAAHHNIAIVGFANDVPVMNRCMALMAGFVLASKGCNVVAGNIKGTFSYGFLGAKLCRGNTMAIVDSDQPRSHPFADTILTQKCKHAKHQQVVSYCHAALVIGGGKYSIELLKEFSKKHKPIIAVCNSHGIVDNEISEFGIQALPLIQAINWLLETL
ncbi:MAG: hypothetical protein HRT52_12805 [Colwellia sp.]|nr:hypothetical protein [Colwellia sp.]